MPDHYFTPLPQSEHKPGEVRFAYRGVTLRFVTDSGVFSRTELDRGTEVLLNALPETLCGDVLDMGCGYGAIGVAVGARWGGCRVTMTDVNARACGLAEENAKQNGVSARVLQSDGYEALGEERFDWILQNPPIRAGKVVIYGMFAQAARRLNVGGSLWLVIRKQQGAPSAHKYLSTLFADVSIIEKEAGYWIFRCMRPLEKKDTQA